MATLQELKGLMTNSDLQEKVIAALFIAVQDRLENTPTADEQKYAGHVFGNPGSESTKALASILATNATLSVSAITGASDVAIVAVVASVLPTLVVAFNAT